MNSGKKALLILVFTSLLFLIACSPSPPAEDKIRSDLVGQTIVVAEEQGYKATWRILADEIRELKVEKRIGDKGQKTEEVHVAIELDNADGYAKGPVRIFYRLFDQGWMIDRVETDPVQFVYRNKIAERNAESLRQKAFSASARSAGYNAKIAQEVFFNENRRYADNLAGLLKIDRNLTDDPEVTFTFGRCDAQHYEFSTRHVRDETEHKFSN